MSKAARLPILLLAVAFVGVQLTRDGAASRDPSLAPFEAGSIDVLPLKGAAGHDVCFIHPKGNEERPVAGEGVLIELVQAPPHVVAANSSHGAPVP